MVLEDSLKCRSMMLSHYVSNKFCVGGLYPHRIFLNLRSFYFCFLIQYVQMLVKMNFALHVIWTGSSDLGVGEHGEQPHP